MAGKYDKYIIHPPYMQIMAGDDGRIVFNGKMVHNKELGYPMTLGLQFITAPMVSDNPCHTHNFDEFLCWYGGNPKDPDDFGAEVILYMGEELEKYVFTRPTIVYLPPDLPHCPLEIVNVRSPIIQVEIMLTGPGGTRDVYFDKDKVGHKPVTFKIISE